MQLAHLGCPILGDRKYGSRRKLPAGIALHAHTLEIAHPVSKEVVTSSWRRRPSRSPAMQGRLIRFERTTHDRPEKPAADLSQGVAVSTHRLSSRAGFAARSATLKVAVLLAIAIWSFCRRYYFAFYVIEHYVDPGYKFAGLGSFAMYLLQWSSGLPGCRLDERRNLSK